MYTQKLPSTLTASSSSWFSQLIRLLVDTSRVRSLAGVFLLLLLGLRCSALTFISAPAFTPSTKAPLAGLLQLKTDTDSRVSVEIDDGTDVWSRRFYDYGGAHSIPLAGFKPNRTNQITVAVFDKYRNSLTSTNTLVFVTPPLPSNFPNVTLLKGEQDKMEPGYTLFRVGIHNELYWYVTIVDNSGQVVWYGAPPSTADVRQLDNGNLFMPYKTNLYEVDLLGNTVSNWVVPTNLLVNVHDGVPTSHGTILYLSDATEILSNYPTSMTISNPPLATSTILYQKVVEISATNAGVLHTWSPINVLDPYRTSYLIVRQGAQGWDTEHCNAIIEDPSDDSLIVSMRHQNAVVKFSRATGQLKWILGPPENWSPAWQPYLLKPVGSPFAWQYGQHSPVITPQGTLILFDDGNFRASPFQPYLTASNYYSRAVEYAIDETNMTVSQVWDYGRTNAPQRIYVDHEGSAQPLPQTGNVLVDFSAVNYINAVPPDPYGPTAYIIRIQEVTHDPIPEVVFDLQVSMYDNSNSVYHDCTAYRAQRIPDLYPHTARPVEDLTVSIADGLPLLRFAADDAREYVVQASDNLVDWADIGVPTEDEGSTGEFEFTDLNADNAAVRFYRIITH